MISKNYFFERIITYRDYFFPFKIFYDRTLYFFFFKKHYKAKFKFYGDNISWGRDFHWKLIPRSIRISNPDKIEIHNGVLIDDYVFLQVHNLSEGLIIGSNTRINSNSHIQAFSKIELGEEVLIAPFSQINSGNHGFQRKDLSIMQQEYKEGGVIRIGNGTWIGRGASILGGVELGVNTVVAASAVVTKSFNDFAVIGGVPAKKLKN